MTTGGWIDLPGSWSLQNVQAALNVLITGLSVLAVFACARFCWQSSVTSNVRYESVPVSTLLSISTFGEAVDVLWLLKSKVFSRKHTKILIQACLVVFLSFTALISGPIARFSTQIGHNIGLVGTQGSITWRRHDSILGASVIWNQTFFSLDKANFPYDQLLDFLPDPAIEWVYDPKEWNSSWSLTCNDTDLSRIKLEDVGNCTSIFDEIPALTTIISLDKYDKKHNTSSWWSSYYEDGMHKDVLLSIGAAKESVLDEQTGFVRELLLDLAVIHLHKVNLQNDSDSSCFFGKGPIESTKYTKIECIVRRNNPDPALQNIAFPDSATPWLVARALVQNYQAQFISEAIRGDNITVITPQDLVRFYQVWVATKDTQNAFPVTRSLSVMVPIVQLSIVFLVIAILILLLVLYGILSYIFAAVRYRKVFEDTPQSKLEWILKVIESQHGGENGDGTMVSSFAATPYSTSLPTVGHSFDGIVDNQHMGPGNSRPAPLKRSATSRVLSIASSVQQNAEKRRSDFENARYSNSHNRSDDRASLRPVSDHYQASARSSDQFSFVPQQPQSRPRSFNSEPEIHSYHNGDHAQPFRGYETQSFVGTAETTWSMPPLSFQSLGSAIPRKPVGSDYTNVAVTEVPPQPQQQAHSHRYPVPTPWRATRGVDAADDPEVERLVFGENGLRSS